MDNLEITMNFHFQIQNANKKNHSYRLIREDLREIFFTKCFKKGSSKYPFSTIEALLTILLSLVFSTWKKHNVINAISIICKKNLFVIKPLLSMYNSRCYFLHWTGSARCALYTMCNETSHSDRTCIREYSYV